MWTLSAGPGQGRWSLESRGSVRGGVMRLAAGGWRLAAGSRQPATGATLQAFGAALQPPRADRLLKEMCQGSPDKRSGRAL